MIRKGLLWSFLFPLNIFGDNYGHKLWAKYYGENFIEFEYLIIMIIIATESKVCESNMNIGKDSMVKLDIDV
jgi:hypothetical protein